MARSSRFPALYKFTNHILSADLSPGQYFDMVVLGCLAAGFIASLKCMGGANTTGTEWPVRWVAAALALHAYAIHSRTREGRGRLHLGGLLLLPAALWLYADGFIHPGSAWPARESATMALTSAATFWLVMHHTRHTVHSRFLNGVLTISAATMGAMSISGGGNLLPKLAGRTSSAVYAGQATGPFGTPGEYAALLLVCMAPALVQVILPVANRRHRVTSGYILILILIGIWATHTASVWCGLIIAAGTIIVLRYRRPVVVCATIGIAAVALGLIYSAYPLQSGLFRSVEGVAPLHHASLAAFMDHPLVGGGAFATTFEAHRPVGWTLDPSTAGGFLHHTLAENGIVGALFILGPIMLLAGLAWRALRKMPLTMSTYDRQFNTLVIYTPESVLSILAMFAAGAAAATVFLADYARPNLSIALALAILGGSVARDAFGDVGVKSLHAGRGIVQMALRRALIILPAVALLTFTLPILRGIAATRMAQDMLDKAAPQIVSETQPMPAVETRLAALEMAISATESALRYTPANADAQATRAAALTARFNISANPAGLGDALAMAQAAAAATPGKPGNVLPYIELLRTYGRFNDALAVVDRLYAAAPRHPTVVLEYARTHLSDESKRTELRRILAEQAGKLPSDPEGSRLLNLLELAASN